MITLSDIRHINFEANDEIWLIVRSAGKLGSALLQNPKVKVVTDLSPSQNLFFMYRNLAKENNWHKGTFESIYVPRFLKDLRINPESLRLLNVLKDESFCKNIQLVCFCSDEKLCHRSIVGGVLANLGANIVCNEEYKRFHL